MSLNMSKQEEINYKVSNPMDLLFDDNYLKKAVADETLIGGNIGAGLDWGSAYPKLLLDLPLLGRLTTLRVSLNREIRLTIETWDLGVGASQALIAARACIKEKLISPLPEVIPHLQAALQQDDLYDEEFISNREVLRSLLKILLTDSDWETIAVATASSVREQVLSQVSMEEKVSV
jgi:hypothetical protein